MDFGVNLIYGFILIHYTNIEKHSKSINTIPIFVNLIGV